MLSTRFYAPSASTGTLRLPHLTSRGSTTHCHGSRGGTCKVLLRAQHTEALQVSCSRLKSTSAALTHEKPVILWRASRLEAARDLEWCWICWGSRLAGWQPRCLLLQLLQPVLRVLACTRGRMNCHLLCKQRPQLCAYHCSCAAPTWCRALRALSRGSLRPICRSLQHDAAFLLSDWGRLGAAWPLLAPCLALHLAGGQECCHACLLLLIIIFCKRWFHPALPDLAAAHVILSSGHREYAGLCTAEPQSCSEQGY